jgi:hypothetical protein
MLYSVYQKRCSLLKNSLVPLTGPRFGCREPDFGRFEPALEASIGSVATFSTGSLVSETLSSPLLKAEVYARQFVAKPVSESTSQNKANFVSYETTEYVKIGYTLS